MTHSVYAAMADLEVIGVRESPFSGLIDPRVAGLRCFKFYSRESGSIVTSPDGKDRWIAQKQTRVYAILHRLATSGERSTMRQVAGEAMCCPSTVSRAITRLQAFGFFAVDVTRGRNGGIRVRFRTVGDHLKHYARAAWGRIRSLINVASRSPGDEEGTWSASTPKDATFIEDRRIERDGARILAGEISIDEALAAPGRAGARRTEADLEHERAAAWALEVIAERIRLDREDPDWDLLLEQARERWIIDR